MTALDFPIRLGAAGLDVHLGDPEVVEMPGEVGAPLGAVVSSNPAARRWKSVSGLLDEVNGGPDRVVVVDLQDGIARGFIDRRELVEAPRVRLEVLDVDLDRLARDVNRTPALRPGPVRLLGDAEGVVLAQGPPNRRVGSGRPRDTTGGRAATAARRTGAPAAREAPAPRGATLSGTD